MGNHSTVNEAELEYKANVRADIMSALNEQMPRWVFPWTRHRKMLQVLKQLGDIIEGVREDALAEEEPRENDRMYVYKAGIATDTVEIHDLTIGINAAGSACYVESRWGWKRQ